MAVLALAVAGSAIGAAIGGTFLGMSAASIGWSLGSMAGNLLFAPDAPNVRQEGPRLGDLKVSSATYGTAIPRGWGAFRVAGNMIWSTPIIETRHETTTESGGKGGGGGGSVTQISYTYAQSFAIALCEGEIVGVRKIWANGTLIYNTSDDADAATLIASNQKAAGIRIYRGSETQTADSLIQSDVGAADTPAYRGTAYVVFEALQLADYGNRTPNLEFEVVVGGASVPFVAKNLGLATSGINYGYPLQAGGTVWNRQSSSYSSAIQRFDLYTGQVDRILSSYGGYATVVPNSYGDLQGAPFLMVGGAGYPLLKYKNGILTNVGSAQSLYGAGDSVYELRSGRVIWSNSGSPIHTTDLELGGRQLWAAPVGYSASGIIYSRYSDYIFVRLILTADSTYWLARIDPETGIGAVLVQLGASDNFLCGGSDGYLYFFSGGTTLTQYDNAGTLLGTATVTSIGGSPPRWCEPRAGTLLLGNGTDLRKIDMATMTQVATGTATGAGSLLPSLGLDGIAFWMSGLQMGMFGYEGIVSDAITTLDSIVSDICASADLAAGDIDVTDLSAEVLGYAITRGTARSHLQQPMQAFFFDAVESDGKIKFVTRGGAAVATIAEDDLAAHEYGSAVPDALTTNRAQDLELPREVAINFPNVNAAYQVSTQLSPRLITSSENKISHNLAVVMTPTKGKQVADVLLYDAWTARSTLELATGWKYGYLEPTDVVTITNSGRSYTVRLVDETADGGIFRRSAVVEDADVYTQSAAAAESQTPDETLAPVPPTRLQLLDIPLLRDQDDGVGFYAAAAGNTDAWRGAQLFKSNDSGLTWAAYGNGFLNGATMGVALTALGNFTLNQFDEANRVSILLASGELASDTEINILNGANVALLGDEIIQFKTATLTATRTYLLSGLLRGRRGTEWARSTHAISDRFVLITATTLYLLPAASAEYDLERTYRAVSFGSFLDDAEEIDFTHTAVALIPYAPVHLGGGRDASGNLTLTWIRRTRISGGWNNYADVPLGEDSQAYEVEIYSSATYATLKRTITGIGSATTSYTAAQQTTDFGAPQSTVYFIVYQVSATVGRGYEARGVI